MKPGTLFRVKEYLPLNIFRDRIPVPGMVCTDGNGGGRVILKPNQILFYFKTTQTHDLYITLHHYFLTPDGKTTIISCEEDFNLLANPYLAIIGRSI